MSTERNEPRRFCLITRAPCAAVRQLSRRLARVSTSTIRASMPSSNIYIYILTKIVLIKWPVFVIKISIGMYCLTFTFHNLCYYHHNYYRCYQVKSLFQQLYKLTIRGVSVYKHFIATIEIMPRYCVHRP